MPDNETAPTVAPESPAAQGPETPYPEWAETPPETVYALTMHQSDGDPRDEVEVTRAEYIHLKRALAGLRGLPWPEESDAA